MVCNPRLSQRGHKATQTHSTDAKQSNLFISFSLRASSLWDVSTIAGDRSVFAVKLVFIVQELCIYLENHLQTDSRQLLLSNSFCLSHTPTLSTGYSHSSTCSWTKPTRCFMLDYLWHYNISLSFSLLWNQPIITNTMLHHKRTINKLAVRVWLVPSVSSALLSRLIVC